MKRAWNYVVTMWQPASILLAIGLLVSTVYFYRIGSLLPAAPQEVAYRTQYTNLSGALKNPIELPHRLLRHTVYILDGSLTAERVISAILILIAVLLFYYFVSRFNSKTASFYGTTLFATSSIMLNTGRLALPNVIIPGLLLLLLCGYNIQFKKTKQTVWWLISTVILCILLYTPGILYFLIGGLLVLFLRRKQTVQLPKPLIIGICIVVGLLLLTPLVLGLVRSPHLLRMYLAISVPLPGINQFLKNFAAVPYGLFIKAPQNPLYRLGTQPVLDVFTAVLLLVGSIALARRFKLVRIRLVGGMILIGAVFTAISGNYENAVCIVPFIYMFVTSGLEYLLKVWRDIFPYNPLARTLSIVIIGCAVVISANFHLWRYAVAWPHNNAVKQAFTSQK